MDASSDLLALLELVPAEYSTYVAVFCEVVFLASVLAAALKRYLGDPEPNDGVWKRRFYKVAGALDWLAANSTPVREKYKTAKLKRDIRTIIPPPSPNMRTTIFEREDLQ